MAHFLTASLSFSLSLYIRLSSLFFEQKMSHRKRHLNLNLQEQGTGMESTTIPGGSSQDKCTALPLEIQNTSRLLSGGLTLLPPPPLLLLTGSVHWQWKWLYFTLWF